MPIVPHPPTHPCLGYIWPVPFLRSIRRITPLVLVAFVACEPSEGERDQRAKGGRSYGGVFNMNEGGDLGSLFPLALTHSAGHRIAAQVYEGLVGFDQKDLSTKPALAESWTIDESGTEYTFKLQTGVRFHDDTCFADGIGRAFTAADVVDCFTALCTYSPQNQMFWLFQDRVLGANAQYAATMAGKPGPGLKGVEALDPQTVRIRLSVPYPNFLQILAHQGCWIYPKELIEHYGANAAWHTVGTGPFHLKHFIRGEVLVLERWPHHWDRDEFGDPYPFLDAVRCTFIKDKQREFEEFKKGNLSVIYELPLERTDVLRSETSFQVQSTAGLSIQFYGFNHSKPPFNDVRIRQAVSLAIDRQLLVDSVLSGLGIPAGHGVVAPGFADYPYDSVPALVFDPDRARALLAEAGFPGGVGLPNVYLQVNSDGFGYVRVAEAVQEMLARNLGVRVIATVLPADQHYDRIEFGRPQLWREGWIADHPDPENFLALFYGKNVPVDTAAPSYLNSTRYRNARYDSLFAQALRSSGTEERMRLLALAERQVMEDMVVAPLYHERVVRLLQPWVRDLPINGMEHRDLRGVWFDPALRKGQ